MSAYITATCCKCKKAYMRKCSDNYFRETPDKYHCCPECKAKGFKDRPPRTPEQIAEFKQKMEEYRKRKQNER